MTDRTRYIAGLVLVAVMLFFIRPASAQTGLISGTVYDNEGQPLFGATVANMTKKEATMTDDNGRFSIKAAPDDDIEISFLGFKTVSMKAGKRSGITVTLQQDEANRLEDAVVIGYGSVAKKDLTGSVSVVKMNDIKEAPVTSVDNALQGRIAGADFLSTSGAPGASTSIRIRGTRSISASNEPLIVVDGVMDAIHDLNDINSNDIASISVLKDASSTAIYGSRGSNGVILITTKQGMGNKDVVNITWKSDVGMSMLPRHLDLMNASEFAQYRNDYAAIMGDVNNPQVGPNTPLSGSVYSNPLALGKGTNWIEEITRKALYMNHALSISGRSDKSSYYASFAYNDTEGIIQDSGQKRITGRINLDRQLFKWLKVGFKGAYTLRHVDVNKATIGGTNWWAGAQYLSPMIKPDDTFNPLYNQGQTINTPRALIDMNTHYMKRHSTNYSFIAELVPVKGLTVKSIFSYYDYQNHTFRYYPGTLPRKAQNEGGEAYRYESHESSMSSETTVKYNIDKKKRWHFDILGGLSAYKTFSHTFSLSGEGYMDDSIKWNNMNAVLDKETYSASTGYSAKTKTSVFARANFNWRQRYYLTVTGRYDGASNFAANNKWAFFPSAALKWNVTNEKFMKNVRWVDNLSVRLSAGMSGNDAIAAYRSLAALSSTTGGYIFDGSQPVAFYRTRLASPDLTWEKTASYNAAIDLSMFKDRVNITAEAYMSKTTDLLMSLQVAAQTGYTSRLTNIGSTSNKGIELTIDTRNIVKPKFSWTTTFTMSMNRQMVEDIGTENFISAYNSPGNNSYMIYGYVKDRPLNSLWGFKYGGTWKNTEEIEVNKTTKTYVSVTNKPGGARYYDTNHDGRLTREDLIYQGNADPWVYGGIQNSFYFHGFNLNFYFVYSLGGKIYNYSEFYMAGSQFTNQYRYMLDAWHPVRNPNSDIPAAGAKSDAALPSDFMIHDASYLRLKDLTLSYTFRMKDKVKWLKDITVGVTGQNLWLWKKYNGYDPDVSSEGSSSTLRRMDLGAYPKPRTVLFSVQIRY